MAKKIRRRETGEHPMLSMKERDRRWGLARQLMKSKELDCLIVSPGALEAYDAWFTNDNVAGILVFPLKGEPCYIVWSPLHGTLRMLENRKRGIEPWVQDYRVQNAREGLVELLLEKGFGSAHIGVIGVAHRGPGALGGIPYEVWSHVLMKLPEANFIDVELPFLEMTLVKSEEEMALIGYSARIGELACEAMVGAAKPGASEAEICAAITHAILANGASAPVLIMQTGLENLSWGRPMWLSTAQPIPILGKGDLIQAEIFVFYGGVQTQQQLSVATKPVTAFTQELADIAHQSYEAGVKTLIPGNTSAQVYEAMKKPLDEAGCSHLTPLFHGMNPQAIASPWAKGIDQIPELKNYKGVHARPGRYTDWIIQPGMVFELEPNAYRGKQKVNVGGTVIVGEKGGVELNRIPIHMQIRGN